MKYQKIIKGEFVVRVNRFTAKVKIETAEVLCHVKNTGRLRELLVEGTEVYLEKADNPTRKTAYSLIAVKKDGFLVNIDSQAPNKMVREWLEEHKTENKMLYLKPECTFGNSRFDFYMETEQKKEWIEVKGVTLVENEIAMFPDAPTQRGMKHIEELIRAVQEGYSAKIIFVIQRKGVKAFSPNKVMHPDFAEALRKAAEVGVEILAYDSIVTENSVIIDGDVEVLL